MKIVPMSLELLNCMGDDISVVNAARVSFDKESEWDTISTDDFMAHRRFLEGGMTDTTDEYDYEYKARILNDRDQKLIRYLATHNHWSPFSHVFLSFRIKVPMFLAMQLDKHTVGLTTNSVSRRYVSSEPEFYFPEVWRKAADNVKQGSSDDVFDLDEENYISDTGVNYTPMGVTRKALQCYEQLIREGCCSEQARMVLPMNTMRESIWSGSLAAFARVYKLRSDSHAQKEIREVANKLSILVPQQMKHSWKALTE